MSAFKKTHKAMQKPHRERSQPESRQHLGILEKSSDYKARARNYHNKEKRLKILHKKALERNPDEFYHKMIHKKLTDGEHWLDNERPEQTLTQSQKKLMQTQDMNYIQMKLQMENKKLEKLSRLVDFNEKFQGKRTIFVDTEKEAKRVKVSEEMSLSDLELTSEAKEQKAKIKREIEKRKQRRDELRIIADKMESQKQLQDSSVQRKLISRETKTAAAVYKWRTERKK